MTDPNNLGLGRDYKKERIHFAVWLIEVVNLIEEEEKNSIRNGNSRKCKPTLQPNDA